MSTQHEIFAGVFQLFHYLFLFGAIPNISTNQTPAGQRGDFLWVWRLSLFFRFGRVRARSQKRSRARKLLAPLLKSCQGEISLGGVPDSGACSRSFIERYRRTDKTDVVQKGAEWWSF
jgi:hypothetical protein